MGYELDAFLAKAKEESYSDINDILDATYEKSDKRATSEEGNNIDAITEQRNVTEEFSFQHDIRRSSENEPINLDIESGYKKQISHKSSDKPIKNRSTTIKTKERDICHIRDFPKPLIRMMRQSLGEAGVDMPYTKLVTAFVYANRDPDIDIDYSGIPEDAIELASCFQKYKTASSIDRRTRLIEEKLNGITDKINAVELAAIWLAYDRAGLVANPVIDSPDSLPLSDERDGIELMKESLEAFANKVKRDEAISKGRPIR